MTRPRRVSSTSSSRSACACSWSRGRADFLATYWGFSRRSLSSPSGCAYRPSERGFQPGAARTRPNMSKPSSTSWRRSSAAGYPRPRSRRSKTGLGPANQRMLHLGCRLPVGVLVQPLAQDCRCDPRWRRKVPSVPRPDLRQPRYGHVPGRNVVELLFHVRGKVEHSPLVLEHGLDGVVPRGKLSAPFRPAGVGVPRRAPPGCLPSSVGAGVVAQGMSFRPWATDE